MFAVLFSSPIKMAEELPKKRRPSLGTLQALKAKSLVQPVPLNTGFTHVDEVFKSAKFILSLNSLEIFDKTAVKIHDNMDEEIEFISGNLECVGLICLFTFGRGGGHFVPYVRVAGIWYNGDNEVGFLRRRNTLPSVFMQYKDPSAEVQELTNYASDIICFYADPSLFSRGRRPVDGKLVFGQTDKTCGPDALQTVLMFADGFYENYMMDIYSKLKRLIPARRPKNMEELKGNIRAFDKKKYLALLSNVNVTPESRGSILFILLMFSRYKQIELLEERGEEKFEVVPNSENRPYEMLKNNYEYQQIRKEWSNHFNPIYEAVIQRYPHFLKMFLKHGEDPNIRESNGDTPLLRAVSMGYTDIVQLLLTSKDLDINIISIASHAGYTPLMHACNHMNPETVDILCKAGADVNKTDVRGKTALMIISSKRRGFNDEILPIVDILLKHGADTNAKDSTNETAYGYSQQQANKQLMDILEPLTAA
jgi:hypothetical protein